VHYFRYAKTEIWAQEYEKQHSDIARERHEFHLLRLEREKREREERHKKKRAALKKDTDDQNTKKDAIQAAMERAKEKREANKVAPKNIDNLTPEQQQQIAEVDARRAEQNTKTTSAPNKGHDS
jgi:electron transport complex protein RnfC